MLVLLLVISLGLGLYMNAVEINQKPTPRALLNYGTALYHNGDIEEAIPYWDQVIHYNETYGIEQKITSKNGKLIKQAILNKYCAEKYLKTGKVPKFVPNWVQ